MMAVVRMMTKGVFLLHKEKVNTKRQALDVFLTRELQIVLNPLKASQGKSFTKHELLSFLLIPNDQRFDFPLQCLPFITM